MRKIISLAVLLACGSLLADARAADKKPLTPDRVGQLLTVLRSDLNEDHRAQAAQELGKADGAKNPEVVAYLIEALQYDPKPAVRSEALDSLIHIRPFTPEVGKAIEIAKDDASFKIRWKARTAAKNYHTVAYQNREVEKKAAAASSGPALPKAAPAAPPASSGGWLYNLFSRSGSESRRGPTGQTAPPPLADPIPSPKVAAPSTTSPGVLPASGLNEVSKSASVEPAKARMPVVPSLPGKEAVQGPDL